MSGRVELSDGSSLRAHRPCECCSELPTRPNPAHLVVQASCLHQKRKVLSRKAAQREAAGSDDSERTSTDSSRVRGLSIWSARRLTWMRLSPRLLAWSTSSHVAAVRPSSVGDRPELHLVSLLRVFPRAADREDRHLIGDVDRDDDVRRRNGSLVPCVDAQRDFFAHVDRAVGACNVNAQSGEALDDRFGRRLRRFAVGDRDAHRAGLCAGRLGNQASTSRRRSRRAPSARCARRSFGSPR